MANKTYIVVKDGEELKELKSLTAAKKLADTEGAEVFCDGKCVYQGTVAPTEDTVEETAVAEEQKPEVYTLTRKMNVRKAPSMNADKLTVLEAGTVVEVLAIEDDWLHVRNGAGVVFILYGGGKYARKN